MEEKREFVPQIPEIRESPESPPFQIGDKVRARNPNVMIDVINRPFKRLIFGKSQPQVTSIRWYEDQFRKCWAITLFNCRPEDIFYARDFELVPQEDLHSSRLSGD